jgi:signal transduction histidine kinase
LVAEEVTQSKFGFIGEINEAGLEDIAISNPGWDACKVLTSKGHRIPFGNFKIHGIYGRVISEGKGFFTNDPLNYPGHVGLPIGHPPLKSFLGVPLVSQGKTIGIVAVGNREGGYGKDELEALEALAPAMVEAFLRKRAEVQLEDYKKNLEKLVEERTKQLKDAERLAAIGATAGMVGHDIRNPLQAILGDLYLAREEITGMPNNERKQAMNDSLAEIEKNIEYINKIVADLQDFARPLKPNAEETDLKRIIDELLAKNGLPENVKVSIKVETEKVVADSTFINRIMYNLVTNAVQAMPNGGKLTIRAYNEANETVISVKDTGVGIPEVVKSKLFTPMFTTKSKGQGFGLAVIKRMTEALGGTVSFESTEGKGTTFIVRLPSPKELNGK